MSLPVSYFVLVSFGLYAEKASIELDSTVVTVVPTRRGSVIQEGVMPRVDRGGWDR